MLRDIDDIMCGTDGVMPSGPVTERRPQPTRPVTKDHQPEGGQETDWSASEPGAGSDLGTSGPEPAAPGDSGIDGEAEAHEVGPPGSGGAAASSSGGVLGKG